MKDLLYFFVSVSQRERERERERYGIFYKSKTVCADNRSSLPLAHIYILPYVRDNIYHQRTVAQAKEIFKRVDSGGALASSPPVPTHLSQYVDEGKTPCVYLLLCLNVLFLSILFLRPRRFLCRHNICYHPSIIIRSISCGSVYSRGS